MLFGPTALHIILPQVYLHTNLYMGRPVTYLELEHKAMWEIKKLKLDLTGASKQRLNESNEFNEFLLKA